MGLPVTVHIGPATLTLPNAQPDANGVDVYYEGAAKAATLADQVGDEMKDVMDDVQQDTTYLQQIQGMQDWKVSNWSDDPQTAIDRTALLMALGELPSTSVNTAKINFTNANGQANYFTVTLDSSGNYTTAPQQIQDSDINANNYISDSEHQDGTLFHAMPSDQYYVLIRDPGHTGDPNYQNLYPVTSIQKYYVPNDDTLAKWKGDQQTLINKLTQLSQSKQAMLQDLVAKFNQFLTWISNTLQRRESNVMGIWRNVTG
jgi:hypothetical protein